MIQCAATCCATGHAEANFDLGFYGEGRAREHVFDQPGWWS